MILLAAFSKLPVRITPSIATLMLVAGAHGAQSSSPSQPAELAEIERGIQRLEYQLQPTCDAEWSAPNRAQGLRLRLSPCGITVTSRQVSGVDANDAWRLELATVSFGRDGAMHAVENSVVAAKSDRVEIAHESLLEWFVNDERGVEHGWTIDAKPSGDDQHDACIGLGIGGTLSLRIAEDGSSGTFVDAHGSTLLRYHSLAAWDSNGAPLEVRLEPSASGPRIRIADRGAVYPITVDPVLSGPAWVQEGNQVHADFGYSVCTAGDVNGDGFSDVIVAADLYDNGQTDEGRVYLYLGSASGLSTTPAWTAEGNQANALFGFDVGTAGDVNGDGFDDVIIGAVFYDNGQTDEGQAFLYLGSANGLNNSPAWTAKGGQANANFSYSVATAGDVNGDGYGDVVVGALLYDSGEVDEGRAYLYLGSASGLSPNPIWTAESNQAGAQFGFSVSTAGDVNGDGFGDVVVGAAFYDNGEVDEGGAFLYLGSAIGLAATPSWSTEANQSAARLGSCVANAGDVNGDGYADVIVGAYLFDNGQANEGRVWVFLGSASGLLSAPAWTFESDQDGARLGYTVATAGDVNGDGFADILVESAEYSSSGYNQNGRVFVFLGSNTGLSSSPGRILEGENSGAYFGLGLSTAGDVNGDGFSDVIAGAPFDSNGQSGEGRAYVFFGAASDTSTLPAWTTASTLAGSLFGFSVASAGDVNGDGYGDWIVGAPQYDAGTLTLVGRAFIYLGSSTGLSTSPAWSEGGTQFNEYFGHSVASAGDVNGDGFGDVIVGAPYHDHGELDEGAAFVYLGSATGVSVIPSWIGEGNQVSATYGFSVGTAGDVDGDGFGDVIVGAVNAGSAQGGSAFVYLGSSVGLRQSPSWVGLSNQPFAAFGWSVATAGDVNGDGFSDVVVGAVYFDNGQDDEGRAYVYCGSSTGLGNVPTWTAEGNQASARFGYSVSSAGDVNGDGFSDVIVGAPGITNGQSQEGRAYIYAGAATGLSASPLWTAESDQNSAWFGCSVAGAGDVNGDGYGDVLIGACFLLGNTQGGRAFLYYGSASGPSQAPVWVIDGSQAQQQLGRSVASVGDVNGDGLSDLLVGAPLYDNVSTNEGSAVLYLGSAGGVPSRPSQRRLSDNRSISLLGTTDPDSAFRVQATVNSPNGSAGTPAGRERVRLEWEVKSQSQPLNGLGLQHSASYVDTGAVGTAPIVFNEIASGLLPSRTHHWRARITTHNPLFPHTRWVSMPGNNNSETKLRTVCDPSVTSPDCNANGIGDLCDISAGIALDCNHDGIPDSCQLVNNDCDGDSIPDDCEIVDHDCNGNSIYDLCEIQAGLPDTNNDSIPDVCQTSGIGSYCAGDGSGAACPCGNFGAASNGCANSIFSAGAHLSSSGVPSVSHDNFVLLGSSMPNSSALYFQGISQQSSGLGSVFGDGLRCATGSVIRLGTKLNASNGSQYPQGADTRISIRGALPASGGLRFYQVWYRNSAAFCTSSTYNLSNGLQVAWLP